MAIWQNVLDDNFVRSNTSTGAAGTNTGAGNGWIDVQGGVANITSNQLQLTADTINSSTYLRDIVKRPSGEDRQNQRVVAQTSGTLASNLSADIVLRVQSSKDCYLGVFNTISGGTSVEIYKLVSGSPTLLVTSGLVTSPANRSHIYSMDFSAVGVSPTVLTLTVKNVSTGVQLSSVTINDSTAGLQNSSSCGFDIHPNPSGAVSMLWRRVRIYQYLTAPSHPLATTTDFFKSPYNWYFDPSNAFVQSPDPGAYIEADFTGAGWELGIDIANLITLGVTPSTKYPYIVYSVDNGPLIPLQLSSNTASIGQDFLTSGSHTLRLWYRAADPLYDAWSSTGYRLRLTGLTIDSTASTSVPTLRTKRLIAFGDSILQAMYSRGATNYATDGQSTDSFIFGIANALDAEVGIISKGGIGYTNTAANSTPPLFTPSNGTLSSWDDYQSGQTRLISGAFSPVPDYILVMMGYNDASAGASNTDITNSLAGFLAAARTAAGSSCQVFVLVPPGQQAVTGITNGFNAYQASTPDSLCHLIDLGTSIQDGMTGTVAIAGGTITTADGTHPWVQTHVRLAGLYTDRIRQILDAATNYGSSTTWGGVTLI